MAALRAAGLHARWNPFASLSSFAHERTGAWMRRRQGLDQLPARLARRRLYILPTRAGVIFGGLLLMMLLAGLNYASSLALFLTFTLTGFALVAMQQVHRNLLGTEVSSVLAPAVFAGTAGAVQLTLANASRVARARLEAALARGTMVVADLPPGERRQFDLPLHAASRGLMRIGRLRLSTAHPFGLFRTWTWVHAPVEMLVYPRPHGSLPMPSQSGSRPARRHQASKGTDEWADLRAFRDGDSPRQVDWKAYARGAPLLVKEYTQGSSGLREFDFAHLRDPDPEARLSQLARWVVDAEAQGERYGLILPGVRLGADRGPEHRHRCLAALAMFGIEGKGQA